jgi:hypothetical protein
MSDDWSGRRTLVTMFASTAVGFVVWLALLAAVWWMAGGATNPAVDFWQITEALSAAVTAAAVIGGGFVAYRQLAEGASTRYMEVADRLFGELNAPENVAARRWVYQKLPDDPELGLSGLEPEGRDHVKRTLNSLDRVAFLTQAGWIPEGLIMAWMNPMIVKSWLKLKPYVEHERRARGEPDYYEHAERLGERCVAWRAEHLEQAEIDFDRPVGL